MVKPSVKVVELSDEYLQRIAQNTPHSPPAPAEPWQSLPEPVAEPVWMRFWTQLKAPSSERDMAGEIAEAEYTIAGDSVLVRDLQDGRLIGRGRYCEGDNARVIAGKVLREKKRGAGDFYEPLNYPPRKLV